MRIQVTRSPKITSQIEQSNKLKSKLLIELRTYRQSVDSDDSLDDLIKTIELATEGFRPRWISRLTSEMDRTATMMAGPFFTSDEYPIPVTSDGVMTPVMQVDLRDMLGLTPHDVGDGLFQLWCDVGWDARTRACIRVIPRSEVSNELMTPFDHVGFANLGSGPIPEELVYCAANDTALVLDGFESLGIQCQQGYLDAHASNIDPDLLSDVADDLYDFGQCVGVENDIHFLGSFYPIQYSAAEVGDICFISLAPWGSSGNAQVFFEGGIAESDRFFMRESLR